MAAPLVALAGKYLIGAAKSSGATKYIAGATAFSLFLLVIVPIVVLSSVITSIGGGSSADPCLLQNAGFSVNGSQMRVMTWNVCGRACEKRNKDGKGKSFSSRINGIAEEIQGQNPDILAIQEGGSTVTTPSGRVFRTLDRKMHDIGYENAHPGGPNHAVFLYYRRGAFTVVKSGYEGFPSKVGSTVHNLKWAQLANTATGESFMAGSLHTDYGKGAGNDSRRKRAGQIIIDAIRRENTENLPVVLAGDYNANIAWKDSYHGQPLTLLAPIWDDVFNIAMEKVGEKQSTLRGRANPQFRSGRHIDHILVSKGTMVGRVENVGKRNSSFVTDHNPVVADIGEADGASVGGAPSADAKEIPPTAMQAYRKAAATVGLDWAYLAAIGKIETNHGRHGGASIQSNGDVRPKIVNSIGASGPMQFMPGTWRGYGQDGNFDGKKDVHNIYDAALGAARYLKASGAPGNMKKALFAYNRSTTYGNNVIAQANKYRGGQGGPPNVDISRLDFSTFKAAGAGGGWVRPVKGGPITARFGQGGSMWSSRHTGTDFGVGTGTPVFAAQAGSVSVSHPGWAGNLITINHGNVNGRNTKTRYAHLSKVVRSSGMVQAGDLIAYSGARGNVTGPHLHFEVMVDGKFVNPLSFLEGAGTPIYVGDPFGFGGGAECSAALSVGDESGNNQWGGSGNGRIPETDLCEIKFAPSKSLRCDAAQALDLLNEQFTKNFNKKMKVSTAYLSYEEQANRVAADSSAEPPGTSKYGFGLVVTLSGLTGPEKGWLAQKAVGTGWVYGTGGTMTFGATT